MYKYNLKNNPELARERHNAQNREWYKKHKAQKMEYQRKYRAKKKNIEIIPMDEALALLDRLKQKGGL